MIDDDLLGDGEAGGGTPESAATEIAGVEAAVLAAEEGKSKTTTGACISCGASTVGVFCTNCGQKNDDLRRSSFLLARDFVEDTFSFDSRMWRTLGVLAAAPGVVPKNYAHGRRSRYTPPVRLFLVVSFLFFLLLSFTQTLFVAVEITDPGGSSIAGLTLIEDKEPVEAPEDEALLEVNGEKINCDLKAQLRFFVRADAIDNEIDRWTVCVESINAAAKADLATPGEGGDNVAAEEAMTPEEVEEMEAFFDRTASGVSTAIENPRAFNSAFNNWLPRLLFLMTPVLALLAGLFIRGRDALFFDQMVLSLYTHAVGFAMVGAAIVLTQIGVPYGGLAVMIGLFAYFVIALKRTYNRGWIKTVYSSVMISLFYLIILFTALISIVIGVVLQNGAA